MSTASCPLWFPGAFILTSDEKLRRFEQIISPHLASAFNLARWLAGNREDAEDIVQESFLRAFASIETFRGIDGRPWLLAIVRNTALTWLKKNRQSSMAMEIDESAIAALGANPEALMLSAANREQVRAALEQLPMEFRESIVLREMEELSYKEISMVTGAPMGTVMSRLSRGRDWLRGLLVKSGAEGMKAKGATSE